VPNQNKPLKSFAALSGLGFQMLAIIAASTFLGFKLDVFYSNSTNNYYTLGFALSGVILAIVYVVRKIIKHSNRL
tara:strand:+ start:323 stop:547 length:225 start_codon:yes stop_codon:yes gene_type:complete